MPVYEPEKPELGKNAIGRRLAALRVMNEANGPHFARYDKTGVRPSYQVTTVDGTVRPLLTREVPSYVLGAADHYEGIRANVQEAVDAALADPEVSDRDSLIAAVLRSLDELSGNSLRAAAAYFTSDGEEPPVSAVV